MKSPLAAEHIRKSFLRWSLVTRLEIACKRPRFSFGSRYYGIRYIGRHYYLIVAAEIFVTKLVIIWPLIHSFSHCLFGHAYCGSASAERGYQNKTTTCRDIITGFILWLLEYELFPNYLKTIKYSKFLLPGVDFQTIQRKVTGFVILFLV